MRYILVNKSWKKDTIVINNINMIKVEDIKYDLENTKFRISLTTSKDKKKDSYKILSLNSHSYYSNSVESTNHEILNKICFYLSIYPNSNIYLLKGETINSSSDVYQLKLNNLKLNNQELKLLKLYIQGFNTKSDKFFKFDDIWKKCYLNYDKSKFVQPKETEIKLYSYQGNTLYWMQEVESNKIDFSINTSVDISDLIDDQKIYFNPVNMELTSKQILTKLSYGGAILGDEMGSGKTICCASLILNRPSKVKQLIRINSRIYTKATLVLLPGHLASQWEYELKKFNKELNVIKFLTKVHHKKYKVTDILDADVIIVTNQFLVNKNWYLDLIKSLYLSSGVDKWRVKPRDYSLDKTYEMLNTKKKEDEEEILSKGILLEPLNKILKSNCSILNIFHFHRIIADEAHEVLSTPNGYGVNDDKAYLRNTYLSLEADHYWYVTGTPFVDNNSLYTILKFLRIGINNYKMLSSEIISINANRDDIYKKLLKTLYVRHTKESIKDEIKIPAVIEENIFLEFTDIEKALYERSTKGSIIARQMCCHPSINDHDRQAFLDSDNIPNLLETKEKIIKSREDELKVYKERLQKAITSNNNIVNQSEYSKNLFVQRKKELETKIHSIEYILKIFKEIDVKKNDDEEEELCPILLDPIVDGVITKCGHKFSKEGLLDGLKATRKKECPLCRTPLTGNDIFDMSSGTNEKKQPTIDEYTYKYGTKMGKLIRMVLEIIKEKNNRIIIFSQWESLLKLISNTLSEINISNVRCKGNTYQRNAAIMKFKKGLNSKKKKKTAIILLSLENAAAGTNLTEASHIFLVDPIKGTKENVKATEDQAIGRAHRIGQENQVKIYRLIIKDTIEEEIFNTCYKTEDVIDNIINN
jgi:SNF2 family DNA or RNA helicase